MTNLKIIYSETHRVKKIYADEIDPTNVAQWTALIEKVRSCIDDDSILDDLPVEPSDELEDWLFLYYFLNPEDYPQKVDVAAEIENRFNCEREWSIQNQAGEIFIQDLQFE
jgi:hypothetical protein